MRAKKERRLAVLHPQKEGGAAQFVTPGRDHKTEEAGSKWKAYRKKKKILSWLWKKKNEDLPVWQMIETNRPGF